MDWEMRRELDSEYFGRFDYMREAYAGTERIDFDEDGEWLDEELS